MTMTPLPISHIPLWIGGSSDAALKRTDPHRRRLARQPRNAGGGGADREAAARGAAGAGFTISMRTQWNGKDHGELRDRLRGV